MRSIKTTTAAANDNNEKKRKKELKEERRKQHQLNRERKLQEVNNLLIRSPPGLVD